MQKLAWKESNRHLSSPAEGVLLVRTSDLLWQRSESATSHNTVCSADGNFIALLTALTFALTFDTHLSSALY